MTNGDKVMRFAMSFLMLGAVTSAVAVPSEAGNPYQAITDRNVFGLKPPPPPPGPEDNKPPPSKLTLTGLYKMGDTAKALIKVSLPPRPPDPAKEVPLSLAVGQALEGVEVLDIDTVARIVKVNNSGTVMSLDFTNNGAKVTAGPAGAPGGPGGPGGKPPGMGVPPAPNPFVPPAPAPNTTRPIRSAGLPGDAVSPASYASAQPVTTYSAVPTTYNSSSGVGVSASGLTVGGVASTPQAQRNWPPEPQTAEEAAIMGAAYSTKYAKEIQAGTMPSIPGDNPLLQDQQTTQPAATTVTTPNMPQLPPGAARRYVPQ